MKSIILIILALLTFGCHSKNDPKEKPAERQPENSFFTINIPDLIKKQREVSFLRSQIQLIIFHLKHLKNLCLDLLAMPSSQMIVYLSNNLEEHLSSLIGQESLCEI